MAKDILFDPHNTDEAAEAMNTLAGAIDMALHKGEPTNPPKLAFFLIVAEIGNTENNSRVHYVGNIDEADTIDLLARTKERFEAGLGATHDPQAKEVN